MDRMERYGEGGCCIHHVPKMRRTSVTTVPAGRWVAKCLGGLAATKPKVPVTWLLQISYKHILLTLSYSNYLTISSSASHPSGRSKEWAEAFNRCSEGGWPGAWDLASTCCPDKRFARGEGETWIGQVSQDMASKLMQVA